MDDLLRHDDREPARPTQVIRPTDDRVRTDIAALDGMGLADLRALWQKAVPRPCP